MTPTGTRLPFIDAYKALLICLVVLGHAVQGSVLDFETNPATKLIYSHHMAAFFFLSGFVIWRPQFDITKLPRRMGHLLIPFFFWWLVSWILFGGSGFLPSLCGLLYMPDSGLWFLFVLAACHLIYNLLCLFAVRTRLNADIILGTGLLLLMAAELFTGYTHYGFHFLAWYFIFFLFGYWTRKYAFDILMQTAKSSSCLLVASVLSLLWLAMMPFWQRNTPIALPFFGALPSLLAFAYRLLAATCAISAAMLCLGRIHSMPRWIIILGQCTMGIYILHGMLLPIVLKQTAALPTGLSILVATLITLPVATALTLALRRIPLIGKWIA